MRAWRNGWKPGERGWDPEERVWEPEERGWGSGERGWEPGERCGSLEKGWEPEERGWEPGERGKNAWFPQLSFWIPRGLAKFCFLCIVLDRAKISLYQ